MKMSKIDQRQYAPATQEEVRVKTITPDEKKRRLAEIEKLMMLGVAQTQIEHACRAKYGMKTALVRRYQSEIRNRWAEEEQVNRPTNKAAAVRRLYSHIQKALQKEEWAAVAAFERILSDIQGTKEAVEVNLNVDATVTEATLHVIANLSPARREAMLEEQRQLRLLAEKNARPVIEVEATAEEHE